MVDSIRIGAIWTIIANCILGFGDKANQYLKYMNPIEHSKTMEFAKKYKVEPYVIAADIYSNPNVAGMRRLELVYWF